MKEVPWPLFENCVRIRALPDKYKYVLAFCYPRKAFFDHSSTFAHVDATWAKIARIYFRLLAELAVKKSRKIRVFLEAVRFGTPDGPISDYCFYALVKESRDLEPNDVLDKMLSKAYAFMNKRGAKLEPWMEAGSFGNREWMRLCGVYGGRYIDKEERASLKSVADPNNPSCAVDFFSVGNAFANRTAGYCARQEVSLYAYVDEEGVPLNFWGFPIPGNVYELSMLDIAMEDLVHRLLPEIQLKQVDAEGSILGASVALLKRTGDDDEEGVKDERETAEKIAQADSVILGKQVSPERFLAPRRPDPISPPVGKSSVYTLMGRDSATTLGYVNRIRKGEGVFSALRNPLEAARKLYLEHQDLIFDKYRTLCRGNFDNLSPSGTIMVDFIKDGGVDDRRKSAGGSDPALTPWANDQTRRLREYVGAFKATEPSAALINQLRNYMLDAFVVELNRVHLNMILNSASGAKSKSFCTRIAAGTFPDGVVKIISYFSDKAFFTSESGPNQNGAIFVLDDVSPQMLDRNTIGSQDAVLKFIMSTCCVAGLRNVEDLERGGRKREEIYSEMSHCFIFCGNHEWLRCKILGDALKTRAHVKEVDEGVRATSQVQDMVNKELMEGKSPSSPRAMLLRKAMWSESALFFEAACLIACGALKYPTTFVAGVTLEYLRYWFEEHRYPCDQIRDAGRLVSLAIIKCIQDGIHSLFFAEDGAHVDGEYELNHMKDLDPLLFVTVQHMVAAIGEQADLLYNPHEKAITSALATILKEQDVLQWYGDKDYTYVRIVIKGSIESGRNDFPETRAMAFAPLGESVKRAIKERNEDGEVVPTADCICDYLDSMCQRNATCRTRTSLVDAPTPTSFPHGTRGKHIDVDGPGTEKARPLAQLLSTPMGRFLVVQTDHMMKNKQKKHTEILKEALQEFLSVAHQRAKKLIFCPNPIHPSVYEVLRCDGDGKKTMRLKVASPIGEADRRLQGLEAGDKEPEYLEIDGDLDDMAAAKRNEEIYAGERAVTSGRRRVAEEDESEFFGAPIPRGKPFANPDDLLKELDFLPSEIEREVPQEPTELGILATYPDDLLAEICRVKSNKRKRISFA